MKLNQEQIKEIKKLRLEGKKLKAIARMFNLNPNTIKYHTSEEFKKKLREYQRNRYKNMSKEKREEYFKRKREYQREYHRRRYNNDTQFRNDHLQRVKKSRELKLNSI